MAGIAERFDMLLNAYSLDSIAVSMACMVMNWDVTFDSAFAMEATGFPQAARVEIAALVGLLRQFGPQLRRPHCDTLNGSKHVIMKELRFALSDGVWRIAFAFDPERQAILLVGGNKSGVNERRFYRDLIRVADERFDAHLKTLPPKWRR